MDTQNTQTQSSLNISEEVVAAIVQNATREIDGVFSLSPLNSKSGIFGSASKGKSIKISLSAEAAQIDLAIVIKLNYKIKDVCETVQTTIKEAVQSMTGIAVSKVNVFVAGIHITGDESKKY